MNPYKGLRAFDGSDADDFFGRERLVDELLGRLDGDDSRSRLLTLVGPSGSGKSSVVRAGLLPALRRGAVPGSDEWFVTTMYPGAHPFEQLESALLRVAVNPPASLLDQLSSGPRGILRGAQRALPDDRTRLLVVIDQFEELFTLCDDDALRTRFLAGLVAAAAEADSPVRFVLTLRADFYDRPLRHLDFATLIKQNSVTVTPLAGDELEHAIVDPAARMGVEFEAGLVAEIVAEVAGQPGALPLLQYALTELFDQQVSRLLLLEHYRELGGLSGALARRADELYQSSSPEEQSAIRALFGRLITPGEGVEDTRRRVRLSEVMIDEATERVVDTYGSARLLTFDHDPMTREPTVEVAHEALIREWPRLRGWLDDDRQGLRIHRHLTTSASAWAEGDRDDSELYRGLRLDAAAEWVETSTPALNPAEAEFLDASVARRAAEEAAERARVRRLWRLLVTTGVVAIVALIAGAIAFRQQQRADDQAALAVENDAQAVANAEQAAESAAAAAESAELADQQGEEAEAARAQAEEAEAQADLERLRAVVPVVADESPGVAALLAVEAFELDASIESLNVLHNVLSASGFQRTLGAESYLGTDLLDDEVTLVAVRQNAIDLWDLSEGELLSSIPHYNALATAVFDSTADGRLVAVRTARDEVAVRDLTTGETLGTLSSGTQVNDVSIRADGTKVAIAGPTGEVAIWDLTTPRFSLETTLDTGAAEVSFARWSPTEDRLAVVTVESEAQFWDPSAADRLWATEALSSSVSVNETNPFAFLFGSDGRRFAFVSGSIAGELLVFDTRDGSQPVPPVPVTSEGGFVIDAMYWIDEGATIIGVPSQGGVAAVDLTGTPGPEELASDFTRASDVEYSPVLGRLIVAGSGGLQYWSIDGSGPLTTVLPLAAEQREAVDSGGGTVLTSLSPDGSQLLVSVVAPPDLQPTTSFDLTTDPPTPTVYDAEGVVTLGYGPFTLEGDLSAGVFLRGPDGVALGPPVPLPEGFTELAVSHDGRYLGFGRFGGLVDLHTGSGEFIDTLALGEGETYEGAQTAPSFTSDGEYMTVGTTEGSWGLWSTDPLRKIEVPNADQWTWGTLMGSWLFVGWDDGTFLRLDPSTFATVGEPVLNPFGRVGYARLDEANRRVAATGYEFVRVHDLDSGQQLGGDLPYGGGAARPEFSEDGRLLSVPNVDRVTIWNFDTDSWADIACELAGRNLTAQEWEQWGPRTIERRATCPQ